jgi:hypothetical protein
VATNFAVDELSRNLNKLLWNFQKIRSDDQKYFATVKFMKCRQKLRNAVFTIFWKILAK